MIEPDLPLLRSTIGDGDPSELGPIELRRADRADILVQLVHRITSSGKSGLNRRPDSERGNQAGAAIQAGPPSRISGGPTYPNLFVACPVLWPVPSRHFPPA